MSIKINQLDLNIISPGRDKTDASRIVIIGTPGTGKTQILTSLLYHKKHLIPHAVIMSGTESENRYFEKFIPPLFIHDHLNEDALDNAIKRQRMVKGLGIHDINKWAAIILDDCADDRSLLNKPLFQKIFKNGRHWTMLFVLSLQYAMDIPPPLRSCLDGVFLLHEKNPQVLKSLYENYAGGVFPDFATFKDVMNDIANDYTALYIDRKKQNKVENWWECVYWYKADISKLSNFKFGSSYYRNFARDRYNESYKPTF